MDPENGAIFAHEASNMMVNEVELSTDTTFQSNSSSGCWFESFFIFAYIGNNHPN